MNPTRIDLPESVRAAMTRLLEARLADTLDLGGFAKAAHWNVKGPNFIALHKLFDDVHTAVGGFADDIAERSVALGGVARGTARVVAKLSTLAEYPEGLVSGKEHVTAFADRLAAYGKGTRAAIDAADEAGDAGTADLFTQVSREADKLLWFVEAHLQG